MAVIGDTNFLRLVKETLAEEWSSYKQPLLTNEDDLSAGMKLFAQIASDAAKSDSPLLTANRVTSAETESLSGTTTKIKKFVTDNSYAFRVACQTGFPFSLLEISLTELALKRSLEDYGSILFHFMMLEGHWLSESELNERFGRPFERLQASEMAHACYALKRAYVQDNNNKAGYYLLWLIKHAAGCDYQIPGKGSFNETSVAKVLSECMAGSRSLKNTANFVEILRFRSTRLDPFLYQEFLDPTSCSIFLNFTVNQLAKIPMDNWPGKAHIITDLLETVTPESKWAVAKVLSMSQDTKTSAVGKHFLAALKARSLREAIPHFYALIELLPNLNSSHIEIIFGRPFVEFRNHKSFYKDPEFTKRLQFNAMRKVFVHGSLMMGVYDTRTTFGGMGVPPHLLAYDMKTEKLVWGIPLTPHPSEDPSLNTAAGDMTFGFPGMDPAGYSLNKVGELISLHFKGEKTLHFIHPETGAFDSTLELPEASTNSYDCLHISPKGFVYQVVYKDQDQILKGGRIIDKRWISSFEVKTPAGSLHPLSTHCGYQYDFKDRLDLFGPTGDNITIDGCMAAEAQGDKLYSIEKDPANIDRCLFKVRTLKFDHEVVSDVEKCIPLNLKKASFGNICHNRQVILFNDMESIKSPVFITLDSQEVTYSPHKFLYYEKYIINNDSGELWTWDQLTQKIWKVSSATITLMGSLESGRGTTLLHVDQADRLYFVDIPF